MKAENQKIIQDHFDTLFEHLTKEQIKDEMLDLLFYLKQIDDGIGLTKQMSTILYHFKNIIADYSCE